MSYPTRSLSTHGRGGSGSASTASQSPALAARIEEKRAELEHLRELRDLSAAVATQMEALEQKIATLSDGTEGKVPEARDARPRWRGGMPTERDADGTAAIAAVMGNWHNVLRAISMASCTCTDC